VLVDPKGDDFSKYAGATVVTPNRAELRSVVGRWHDENELARKAEATARASCSWRPCW
jgi:bifunctional ADP-heptose synthase (sugar kinase/adenylyltransferase)